MKKFTSFLICAFISFSLLAQDYSQVYIIGNAAPNGWANDQAEAMTQVLLNDEDAVYEWTGQLKSGDFKFINILSTWQPSFNATSPDEAVVLGQTHDLAFNDGENDHKFIIEATGIYTITVNLKKLTMVVNKPSIDLPENLWITGSAIPDSPVKLAIEPGGSPEQFRYNGELIAGGEFKLITSETIESETRYVVPALENTDVKDDAAIQITDNAETAGWKVAEGGIYKIKFDIYNEKAQGSVFTPHTELYLIGGCTSVTWNIGNAIPFAQDGENPNIFVFDGELKINEGEPDNNLFKIMGQQDWGPISFHPNKADKPVLEAGYVFENYPGDYKWSINEDKQGRYIITVDLLNETIKAIYQEGGTTSVGVLDKDNFYEVISSGNKINILFNKAGGIQKAGLFDISGKCIFSAENISASTSIGENLPKGIYLLHIKSVENTCTHKVLVK